MIGFPTVLQFSDVAQPVCVAFYLEDGVFKDGFAVAINIEGCQKLTNFATLLNNGIYSYIDASLHAQHRTLTLTVRAHAQDVADDAIKRILAGTGCLKGESALLTLHIACRYRIGKGTSPTLFSGIISKNSGTKEGAPPFKIVPLSNTNSGLDGLVKKLQFVATWQDFPHQILHVFDPDYLKLDSYPNRERLASLRPDDFPNLSEEVRQRACLNPISPDQSTTDGQSSFELESVPTFKDLLLKALTAGDDEAVWAENARELIENGTSQIDREILKREISETFELQHKVWNNTPLIFGSSEDKSNLLISGPTGSGKTALIDILILRTIIVHQSMCIYLAPTRALTYEFFRKFVKRYGNFLGKIQGSQFRLEDEIVYSTGEQGEFDGDIRACNVSLACMVNEKANILLAAQDNKLISKDSRLGLVVIDELHMMEDAQRGGVLDLVLSKLFYFQSNQRRTNRSLRIAGITTEATVDRLAKFRAFSIGEDRFLGQAIEVSTTRRPVPVTHKVILKVPKEAWPSGVPEVDLCNFGDTRDRNLELTEVRQRARRLASIAGKIAPRLNNERVNFESAITDVVVNKLNDHRFVLVAMATADLLEPALRVKNAIKVNNLHTETLERFKSVVAVADLDLNVRKDIIELAQHGVFIHSSEQPMELRHFIEETFSREVPGDWKAVIFTTETLSFGVNLAADCIVLGQIDFPRDIDGQKGLQSLPLRPNAFHNLLGRAGRYGISKNIGAPAEAIVLLNAVNFTTNGWRPNLENDFLDRIKPYYTTSSNDEQFSALFRPNIGNGHATAPSDLSIAKKRQNEAKRWPEDKQEDADEVYSYAALRSCCDILRFLASEGISASPKEVVRFVVEHSVFGALELAGRSDPVSNDWENSHEKRVLLGYAVKDLLEALARDDLKLLQRQEDSTYHVTDRASALIDTGVRPSAIKPIRTALEVLSDTDGDPKTTVILLLMAFCATPEFWNMAAREFCQDACGAYDEDSADPYVSYAEKLFLLEIDRLQPKLDSKLAFRVANEVFSSAINLKHLYLDQFNAGTSVRRAVFFKLCTATLRWLRGAPYEAITGLYPKTTQATDGVISHNRKLKGVPSGFASKYAEKLGWLADATHKYFGDETALMPARFKVEVKLLAERCRRGLPGSLIPFAESYHDRDGFLHQPRTRTQTIALTDTDYSMLCGYSVSDENSARARSYFARSFRDNLAATLDLKANCPAFFADIQQQIKNNDYDPATFMSGLRDSFSPSVNQSFTVDYYDGCGVVWLMDGYRFDLLLPHVTPQTTTAKRVIFRLVGFWGELASTDGFRISVFGAIILASLIKRELLSIHALMQRDPSSFISVAEFVSELTDSDEIRRLGGFEEQLLAFREPASLWIKVT